MAKVGNVERQTIWGNGGLKWRVRRLCPSDRDETQYKPSISRRVVFEIMTTDDADPFGPPGATAPSARPSGIFHHSAWYLTCMSLLLFCTCCTFGSEDWMACMCSAFWKGFCVFVLFENILNIYFSKYFLWRWGLKKTNFPLINKRKALIGISYLSKNMTRISCNFAIFR